MTKQPSALSASDTCQAIILAGGSGTRLWPYSRTLLPKQLLPLVGKNTMLQQTARRTLQAFLPENIWVVTNEEQFFEVREQLKEIHSGLEAQVIAEPVGRNTLPAILLGMKKAVENNPETVMAVFPADHLIHNTKAWCRALTQGAEQALAGAFVTFGIVPEKPETGYGYIETGEHIKNDTFQVIRFIEKPDLATATQYIAGGKHLWNSGMFMFSTKAFLAAVEKYQPKLNSWWHSPDGNSKKEQYALLPDISIDYGIMEKADNIAVVRADLGWNDLGSWESLLQQGKKDDCGTVEKGDVLNFHCKNSLLFSTGGKLAAVGLEHMIVVQTKDATLVCPVDKVQHVKDVVERLKAENSPLAKAHVTVRRPWGSYTVLEEGTFYKIKRIEVNPGAFLSLQKHYHRSEHWVVISGTAQVQVGEEQILLCENQSVDIPKTALHRLGNPGQVPVEIIEIQSGPYLEEDDIVRYDDVYGRTE